MPHSVRWRCRHLKQGAKKTSVLATGAIVIRFIGLVLMICGIVAARVQAGHADTKRFFHSGDGIIHLKSEKNGKVFDGRYRDENQRYLEDAYQSISAVFGAPYQPRQRILSLRLIEFLDLLEDKMKPGATLIITSGYRAPEYNKRLRKGGALAAKASLHQYGMAADLIVEGVSSERIWQHVRGLGFGGTGYYHGKTVHVDVGPARFWDEKSSGVGTGLSDDNKLIGLVADYDRYSPGDAITMRFIRMTAFPIKVDVKFSLIPIDGEYNQRKVVFTPDMDGRVSGACMTFTNIRQMASLRWRLPVAARPGRYRIQATFCDNGWARMPIQATTSDFEVQSP
jgi:uncharacterized protein YcbK (DUF882 family)